MGGDSVVSVNDVGADRRQDAVGGIGSGDRTFAWRTCLADIAPDTTAAAAGIDPRARGTVEASRDRRNFLFPEFCWRDRRLSVGCTRPNAFSRARFSVVTRLSREPVSALARAQPRVCRSRRSQE